MWGFDYGMGGNEEGVGGEDRAALDVLHRAVGDVWTRNSHLRVLNLLSAWQRRPPVPLHVVLFKCDAVLACVVPQTRA